MTSIQKFIATAVAISLLFGGFCIGITWKQTKDNRNAISEIQKDLANLKEDGGKEKKLLDNLQLSVLLTGNYINEKSNHEFENYVTDQLKAIQNPQTPQP